MSPAPTTVAPEGPVRAGDVPTGGRGVAATPSDGARTPTRRRRPAPDAVGLAVGAALVVGFAVLRLDARSLWLDEAYTLGAANHPWLSLSRTYGTMGLYYVVMAAWTQVSVATWWLRLPSVLFALGSLVVTRRVARRVGGPGVAAVAVPLLALVPMFEWKAIEARSYSLVTLLTCIAWSLTLRAVDDVEADRDLRWWLALVPVAVAGVFSHGLFVVHLAPLLVPAALGPRPGRSVLRLVPALATAGSVALLLRRAGASMVGTHVFGGPAAWARSTTVELFPGSVLLRTVLLAALLVGVVVVVRRTLRTPDPAARAAAVVPVAWLLGPCLALAAVGTSFPVFNPRYLAPVAPGLALTLAVAARHVERKVRRDVGAREATVPVVAGVALGAVLLATLAGTPDRLVEEWRDAAAIVADAAGPDDAILFANLTDDEQEQHRPPFEAAWAEVAHPRTPTVVSSDRPLGTVRRYEPSLRTPAEMGRAARAHDRVWVVDGGSGASVGAAAILDDPAFRGLRAVESWSVPDDIEITLYEWADA